MFAVCIALFLIVMVYLGSGKCMAQVTVEIIIRPNVKVNVKSRKLCFVLKTKLYKMLNAFLGTFVEIQLALELGAEYIVFLFSPNIGFFLNFLIHIVFLNLFFLQMDCKLDRTMIWI